MHERHNLAYRGLLSMRGYYAKGHDKACSVSSSACRLKQCLAQMCLYQITTILFTAHTVDWGLFFDGSQMQHHARDSLSKKLLLISSSLYPFWQDIWYTP